VVHPFYTQQAGGVPEWLSQLSGLKVIPTGVYASTNRWITTHTIDLEQPMALLKVFKTISPVKNVAEQNGNIVLTLK
jgi:hypothetical protein